MTANLLVWLLHSSLWPLEKVGHGHLVHLRYSHQSYTRTDAVPAMSRRAYATSHCQAPERELPASSRQACSAVRAAALSCETHIWDVRRRHESVSGVSA